VQVMKYAEYARYDAIGLAELVRHREVSASELTEAALARMDEANPRVNAVVHRYDEMARASAKGELPDGAFRGVPFLVKNLSDGALSGTPLTMGSRALRDYVTPHDSELVARYRRAGVVFTGTTNSPELGLLGTTEPELYGPTRNPWNLAHSSGGSSGGAAVAVATGIVPVAHASDGGGSIRIPASACGLFGLKPTRGRLPLGPDASDSWNGFVVPHVVTRSVRDSAAFLDATHGPEVGAPYVAPKPERPYLEEIGHSPGRLRIAVIRQSILGKATHPDCIDACEDAAKLVCSLGHSVDEPTLPIATADARLAYLTVVAACTAADITSIEHLLGTRVHPQHVEASTWFMKQIGDAFSAADLERARVTIGQLSRAIAGVLMNYDVIMTPTMAYPPARIGEFDLKPIERIGLAVLRAVSPKFVLKRVLIELAASMLEKTPNTMLFNMTGQPAMSVPLYWNAAGLPIGIQFAGRFGDEAMLFRLAAQLEQARPWADKRPVPGLIRCSVAPQPRIAPNRRAS
jgi:amidase